MDDIRNETIGMLGFSTKISNALKRSRIMTIGNLTERTRAELLKIRTIGDITADEIEAKLSEHGLRLRNEGEEHGIFYEEPPVMVISDIMKPCPFCGSQGEIFSVLVEKLAYYKKEIPENAINISKTGYVPRFGRAVSRWKYQVETYIPRCSYEHCIARSRKRFASKEEAVQAWNTRLQN